MYAMLAAALICLPIDAPEDFAHDAELCSALRTAAIQAEILDPRELYCAFGSPATFDNDLRLIRARWQELHDAPPASDVDRLPNRSTCSDNLTLNRRYREHVESRQGSDRVREVLQEVDRLSSVWDTVRDARCEYYYVTVRRAALLRLREMIGEDAYYAGRLPSPVPLQHFQRIE